MAMSSAARAARSKASACCERLAQPALAQPGCSTKREGIAQAQGLVGLGEREKRSRQTGGGQFRCGCFFGKCVRFKSVLFLDLRDFF